VLETTVGQTTTTRLEGAPAGLTITARLRNGIGTLPTPVTVWPVLDADNLPLSAYLATFTPTTLPVVIEWLDGAVIVGSELVNAITVPAAGTRELFLEGVPVTALITARLRDGDEILATIVTVSTVLDGGGIPLEVRKATFTAPASLPVVLEWLEGGVVVGFELVAQTPPVPAAYFTVAEARQVKPLDDAAKYTDGMIEAMRATVESALERRCAVAFVPRTATETLDGDNARDLVLQWPLPLAVTSLAIDGSSTSTTGLVLYRSGIIRRPDRWPAGDGNVTLTYTHGYSQVPPEIKQAALLLTKIWLVKGPVDDRMTSMSTEDGTWTLATPGLRGSVFGVPFVDAVVQAYSLNVAAA
jgi:hypothetical protein